MTVVSPSDADTFYYFFFVRSDLNCTKPNKNKWLLLCQPCKVLAISLRNLLSININTKHFPLFQSTTSEHPVNKNFKKKIKDLWQINTKISVHFIVIKFISIKFNKDWILNRLEGEVTLFCLRKCKYYWNLVILSFCKFWLKMQNGQLIFCDFFKLDIDCWISWICVE